MKRIIIVLIGLFPFFGFGQDYQKIASDLQKKYKDKEAAVFQSNILYEFIKDGKTGAKINQIKNSKLLSLRYNSSLIESELYDNNSSIGKFYGESSLRQKASDAYKVCGRYTSQGLFYDDRKFCSQELKLKEIGELWQINVEKKFNDAKYLTTVFFQDKYPVLEKKLTFKIPDGIEVEIKEFNFQGYTISRSERKEGEVRIIEYIAKDLQGFIEENFQRGLQFNHPHILILLKSVNIAGKRTNILSSPQDLYSWYHGLTMELKPNQQIYKAKVNELIKDKKTNEDKIKAIYYWVQDNIRYIAFEDGLAGFKPDEAHDVFEKRYGDCKGMANLTKEMLKSAGFDARLTWIGTKRIMYDNTIPSLAINNHMICTVILDGKKYFLDATEKYIPFGVNAERIRNRPVMIEDGEKFIIEEVGKLDKYEDGDRRELSLKINGSDLEGNCKIDLLGEAKKDFLYSYHYTQNDQKQDFISDYLSFNNKNIKPIEIKLPNLEERSEGLEIKCRLKYNGAVSSFSNEYYIDIDPIKKFKNFIIKDERQSDIDFGEKIHNKLIVELQIPAGFSISHLPENLSIKDPEFSFRVNYKVTENKIIYTKELDIHNGIIKKESFLSWNTAIKQLNKAYENQIALKK